MPTARPTKVLQGCESVHGYVAHICFKNGPPHRVGAELEWLVAPEHDPSGHVSIDHLRSTLTGLEPLAGGSRLTFEPGGQVELSSAPCTDLASCWQSVQTDVDLLVGRLTEHGLALVDSAIDPRRTPRRQLRSPRYDAMEGYFRGGGAAQAALGRAMMTATAAVQVNLDAGADPSDVARRWQLLHAIGPTLVAAFANSPVHAGRGSGWKSTRQYVWQHLDPARTAPPVGADPVTAWADYALDAPVMMLRRPGDQPWVARPGFTFREWVDGRAGPGRPTEDDLAYHLTTVFPPVRARGWFEVRYLDVQASYWWPVPVAVLAALTADDAAAEAALAATEDPHLADWSSAARCGLEDPAFAAAAQRLFALALAALGNQTAQAGLVRLVEQFLDRYVDRGRCPADDHDGSVLSVVPAPTRENA